MIKLGITLLHIHILHNIPIHFAMPVKKVKLEKCVEMKPSLSG